MRVWIGSSKGTRSSQYKECLPVCHSLCTPCACSNNLEREQALWNTHVWWKWPSGWVIRDLYRSQGSKIPQAFQGGHDDIGAETYHDGCIDSWPIHQRFACERHHKTFRTVYTGPPAVPLYLIDYVLAPRICMQGPACWLVIASGAFLKAPTAWQDSRLLTMDLPCALVQGHPCKIVVSTLRMIIPNTLPTSLEASWICKSYNRYLYSAVCGLNYETTTEQTAMV